MLGRGIMLLVSVENTVFPAFLCEQRDAKQGKINDKTPV